MIPTGSLGAAPDMGAHWPRSRLPGSLHTSPSQVGLAIAKAAPKSGDYLCPRTSMQLLFTYLIVLSFYKIIMRVNCGISAKFR